MQQHRRTKKLALYPLSGSVIAQIEWIPQEIRALFFQTAESERKGKQMSRCKSQKQLESRNSNVDLRLPFCVGFVAS